jgi:hypothetical protein
MHRKISLIFLTAALTVLISGCPTDNTIGRTYTITYYAEDILEGSLPDSQTKEYGVDIMLAENPGNLIRSGSVLSRWNTARYGSGTDYQLGEKYEGNADLSLYAVWGPRVYHKL